MAAKTDLGCGPVYGTEHLRAGPRQIDHNMPHVRTDLIFASFGVTFPNSQRYNGAAVALFYHKAAVPVWVVFFNAVRFMAGNELRGMGEHQYASWCPCFVCWISKWNVQMCPGFPGNRC